MLTLVTLLAPLLLPDLGLDFKTSLAMGIVIGGISLATAPAVTMAIVEEMKVKGPLPTTLLGVVALDDALAIIAFAISIGVGANILGSGTSAALINLLLQDVALIGLSILLGVILAPILLLVTRFTRNRQESLVAILAIVIIG